jgi:hypothetical protein
MTAFRSRLLAGLRLAAPLAVAVWRVSTRPASEVWHDWLLIVSLLDFVSTLSGPGRARSAAYAAATAFLLGIYLWGQGPHALRLLGVLP